MKLLQIIALVGSASAIRMFIKDPENPEERGYPNTPGGLHTLNTENVNSTSNYTTAPFLGVLGNNATHAPWPAAPVNGTTFSARFGNNDDVSGFNFSHPEKGEDPNASAEL